MATQILAINTTEASSGDVTVGDGETLTVCLKDAAGPRVAGAAQIDIQLKDDANQYFTIGSLTGGKPAMVIVAPGTYRFTRPAGISCGVFSG